MLDPIDIMESLTQKVLGSGLKRLLLVLVLICLFADSIPFGRAQANYQPGVKPGDSIVYGQVSASWNGDLNPQFPVADFLNVVSVQNVITSVNQDNITLRQTEIYNNGTASSFHLLYNTQSGYANNTSSIVWAIAKDLVAPEAGYEAPQAPIINSTVERVFLGSVRTVNVFSQFQVFLGGYASIEEDFDQQTGILLDLTFNLVYSNIYYVTAHLNILITQTSLWSPPVQPDYTISANPFKAMILKGSSVDSTITIQSLNNYEGTINLSQRVTPPGPSVTFNQTSPAVSAGGSVSVMLNFSTSPSVSATNYTVNITATSGVLAHSTVLNIAVTGPAYSLSPAQAYISIPTNSSSTDTVTVTSVGRFNGTVTLRAIPLTPGPALGLIPSTIIVKGGTNTTTLTITTQRVPAGYYTLQVNGTGPLLGDAYIYLQVLPGPPDFTISLSPSLSYFDLTGSGAQTHIVLTSVNGFVGTVNINTYWLNLTGDGTTFQGADNGYLSAYGSTSIQLKVFSPPISIGCCGILQVVGTSGSLSHSANWTIDVPPGPNFTVAVSPASIDLPQGVTGSVNVTVTNTDTFTGPVEWTLGFTAGFNVTLTPGVYSAVLLPGAYATVALQIGPSPPSRGTYIVTIYASSIGHSHSAQLAVTVLNSSAGFTLTSVSPITGQQGSLVSSSLIFASIGNFYANISVSALASPGLVLGWTSQRVQLTPNETLSSILTITVPNSNQLGTYTVNVTATGNGLVHRATIKIQIVAPPIKVLPDFAVIVAPTQLNIQSGQSSTATVTLNGFHNFNGTINLIALTTRPGTTLLLATPTVVLSYLTSAVATTLTISLPADASVGSTYTITVSATNGTATRQAIIAVTATSVSGGQPVGIGGLSVPYVITLGLMGAGIVTLGVFFMMKRPGSQNTAGTHAASIAKNSPMMSLSTSKTE